MLRIIACHSKGCSSTRRERGGELHPGLSERILHVGSESNICTESSPSLQRGQGGEEGKGNMSGTDEYAGMHIHATKTNRTLDAVLRCVNQLQKRDKICSRFAGAVFRTCQDVASCECHRDALLLHLRASSVGGETSRSGRGGDDNGPELYQRKIHNRSISRVGQGNKQNCIRVK